MEFAAALVLILLSAPGSAVIGYRQDAAAAPRDVQTTYDALMALDLSQRQRRFEELDPERKSVIMRTHAQRWLDRNRVRLAAGQIELVEATIEHLSPEAYQNTANPADAGRLRELLVALECRLWRSDLMEAFGPVRTPPPANWLARRLEDVQFWFWTCVID